MCASLARRRARNKHKSEHPPCVMVEQPTSRTSIVWFLLQLCVLLCCLALLFLLFRLDVLDSPPLQIGVLNGTLRRHLIGQDVAIERTVGSVAHYLGMADFSTPLVLIFVGCSGCGKTLAISVMAKQYPYAQTMVASHKQMLVDKLHLSSHVLNLIAVDDLELEDESVCRQLQAVLALWPTMKRPLILILSLVTGASVARDFVLEGLTSGRQPDISELVGAYREVLPDWLQDAQIVPFLPMTRDSVRECVRREVSRHEQLRDYRKAGALDEKVEQIMEELAFFPPENPIFSETGCKQVSIKFALNSV